LPIPNFVTGGILPTGIHDCDLSEVESVFVYNNRRQFIWQSLTSYFSQIKSVSDIDIICIDGSFVTDKENPKDVDIVVEFSSYGRLRDLSMSMPNLFMRPILKDRLPIDLLPSFNFPLSTMEDMRDFFQKLRPAEAIERGVPVGTKKGILRISLANER
jgi:hypothetical protein